MNIENLIRENIKRLKPYSCARDEYSGKQATFLDANENPYDTGCNRYPDPYQRDLKAMISDLKGVAAERIIMGNGSDEIIDILIRSVCEPGEDNIVVFSPGYSMYEVSADINDVEVKKIDLASDFQPDWARMWSVADEHTKIIFLCTPNNPVGTVIPRKAIEDVCERFNGIVLVDEAYIDFTDEPSATSLLDKCSNLVVLQTLSKAWGMAGLRLGLAFADKELIRVLNKVKAPYNISSLTQQKAMEILSNKALFDEQLREIKVERERLMAFFKSCSLFEEVHSSEANFILVVCKECRKLYDYLIAREVVVRLRDIPPLIAGGMRITVGTREENDELIGLLETYMK